jgi:uncharacterized protein YdiU (UPF0061 family)
LFVFKDLNFNLKLFTLTRLPDQTMDPSLNWNLKSTYQSLPDLFFKKTNPLPVKNPKLLLWNSALAYDLNLDSEKRGFNLTSDGHFPFVSRDVPEFQSELVYLSEIFSGNKFPDGASPLNQAYAGHQFGHFTMLGDGRACLLGEQVDRSGKIWDIQWKGSGPTPYSRGGDGRATLSSMFREYIISESMNHFSIPTTRSLALVATGEPVYRERVQPGGVLTRVARSHIRVGTFELAYHFLGVPELTALAEYTIQRLYPEIPESPERFIHFFASVRDRQVRLIVEWMRVGFIHGVMNTDNMSIAGETIDYGPCAFMNQYKAGTVFSSIDRQGRYAYANQPAIAQWNLACLANALLPLLHENQEKSVELAREVLDGFADEFDQLYWEMLAQKIGISEISEESKEKIQELFSIMETESLDFTNTFLFLESELVGSEPIPEEIRAEFQKPSLQAWTEGWKDFRKRLGIADPKSLDWMRKANPRMIPRNHLIENFLKDLEEGGSLADFQSWFRIFASPGSLKDVPVGYLLPPFGGDQGYKTFCGT